MRYILIVAAALATTQSSASVITGFGPSSDGSYVTRGYENKLGCFDSLNELDIRANPDFKIWYGNSIYSDEISWSAQYNWNGGVWIWTCHGDK